MSDSASKMRPSTPYEVRATAMRQLADRLIVEVNGPFPTVLKDVGCMAAQALRTYAADCLSHGELLDARREVMYEIDRMLHLEQVPQLAQIRFWHDRLRGATSNVR